LNVAVIVCNIGHFDNEIQVDRLNNLKGVKKINVKPHPKAHTSRSTIATERIQI